MKRHRLFICLICMMLLSSCAHFSFSNTDGIDHDETETVTGEIAAATSIVGTATPEQASFGKSARLHLKVLAGEIGDRLSGSGNETSAADYITDVFEKIGYTTETQWFMAYDDYEGASFGSSNIVAVKQGESDQQIIVGAHYDSVDDDGSQGADDNASGVAVLLETAERVFNEPTPYTIVFVAFGAEEEGLWGSAHYVDQLKRSEKKKIIGMINLDCLIAGDKVYVYGNEGAGSMRDWVLADAKKHGVKMEGRTDEDMFNEDGTPCECSDFDAFEKSNIPYAYFEATDWDLSPDGMIQVDPQYGIDGEIRHTEFDTISYLDETFPGRIDDHLKVFTTLLYDLITQF